MAMPPAGKTTLTLLVDAAAKKQAQHVLLDQGISMSKWINGVLCELVAANQKKSGVHVVPSDLAEK